MGASIEATEAPAHVISMGSLALAALDRSVLVADLADPGGPRIAGSHALDGRILDLSGDGPLIAVLVDPDGPEGIEIDLVDLSIGPWPRITVAATLEDLRAASLSGTLLAALAPGVLFLVDVSTPAAPVTLSRLDIPCTDPISAASGGYQVAIACGDQGLVIVDAVDPTTPAVEAIVAGEETSMVAGTAGAWVARSRSGLALVRVQADAPASILDVPAQVREARLMAFDGRLLVAAGETQTLVADLPSGAVSALTLVGVASHARNGQVLVSGQASQGAVLELVRVLPSSRIEPVSSMPLYWFESVADTDVDDSRMVVAFREGGVMMGDVSSPSSPHVMHSLVTGDHLERVALTSSTEMALVGEDPGILLMDVPDPWSPPIQRRWTPGGGGRALDVAGNGAALLVTDSEGSLILLDHQGVEHPLVLERRALCGPSTILDITSTSVMTIGTGAGGLRCVQHTPVELGGLGLGEPSIAWTVSSGVVAAHDGLVADALDGSIRVRGPEMGAGSTGEVWLDGVSPEAMAWSGDLLWSVGPDGLQAMRWKDGRLGLVLSTAAERGKGLPSSAHRLMPIQGGLAAIFDDAVAIAQTTPVPVPVARAVTLAAPVRSASALEGLLVMALGPAGVLVWDRGTSPWTVTVESRSCARAAVRADDRMVVAGCHGGIEVDGEPVSLPVGLCDALVTGKDALWARCTDAGEASWYTLDVASRTGRAMMPARGSGAAAVSGNVVAEVGPDGDLALARDDGTGSKATGSWQAGECIDQVSALPGNGSFAVSAGRTVIIVAAPITKPAAIMGRVDTGLEPPLLLASRGTTVMAADNRGRLAIVNAVKPAKPLLVKVLDTGLASPAHMVAGQDALGDFVILVDPEGDAVSARPEDGIVDAFEAMPRPRFMAGSGEHAYMASDQAVWREGGSGLMLDGRITGLTVRDGLLLAQMVSPHRIEILTLDPEGDPQRASAVHSPEPILGAAITGSVACLARGTKGLLVVDLRDVASPVAAEPMLEQQGALGVTAEHMTCRVLTSDGNIRTVSVLDPASPRLEPDALGMSVGVDHLWGAGDILVAGAGADLSFISVDHMGGISLAHDVELPAPVQDLVMRGQLAVALSGGSIFALDLGDGSVAPVLLGCVDLPFPLAGAGIVAGGLLAASSTRLLVLDAACLPVD